jgi:lipopolysaccharide/colanic/teichoic acid biosynthesis glycosyltransferase
MTVYAKASEFSAVDAGLLQYISLEELAFDDWEFYADSIHPSVSNKIKRAIDLVGAVVGLLLTIAMAIPIAIAMTVTDPGPLLYGQIRCGLNGKPFKIWKFRSMIVGAEAMQHLVENEATGHIFKNENDPRITKIGMLLRRTSLDEFPQFWNVLMGNMSLVGTRPPTIEEVKRYDKHHWERLKVKPGVTGEWQVKGRSSIKNFEEIVEMDLNYQRQWSILYDISLILKTVAVVFQKKGAF